MADETPTELTTPRRRPGSTKGTPRWVYAFGIGFVVVVILLFLVQHLVFGGFGGHAPR
jgi:hypothetical protein